MCFDSAAYPFHKGFSMQLFEFLAAQDQLHKEIRFVHTAWTIFIRITCKDRIIFPRQFVYFFFVARVIGDCLPVGFSWLTPLHLSW